MAAVDLSLLGQVLPDLPRYRAALSRSSVALSSEFNLPADRHQLASQGSFRADQRQRFQRPFSSAQRDLDEEAAADLSRLNLRPFSSAGTREVIAEAQRIVDKYRERTLSGRWPTDADTRRSIESARLTAPARVPPPRTQQPPPVPMRQQLQRPPPARNDDDGGGSKLADSHRAEFPLRSPAALFTDPRRRSLATPLPSQQQQRRSRTEVEARLQAMRILREVGLSDAYKSQAEVEEATQQQQQQLQQQHSQLPQHRSPRQNQPFLPHEPPPPLLSSATPLVVAATGDEFASGARPLRTPLASSGYASYEEFQAKTTPKWRHPLPSHVGAGYCDEETRRKVWDWLTEPDKLSRHDYLMKLCD